MEVIPDGFITAVRAVLQPDGSIDLDVSVPGWDDAQTTRIRSSLALVLRAEVDPVEIDLERGDDGTSRLVQAAVRQRLAWLNEKLEQKRDYQRVAASQRRERERQHDDARSMATISQVRPRTRAH